MFNNPLKKTCFLFLLTFSFLLINRNLSFAQINRKYVEESTQKAEEEKKKKKKKVKQENPFSPKGFWEYGFNFGVYFANNNTANYYNGNNNVNNLSRIIGPVWTPTYTPADTSNYLSNPYYKQIHDLYNYNFSIKELPTHMRYDKPINIGFNLKYNVTDNLAIFADFNYAKLTTVDEFSIQLENNQISNNSIIFNTIKGTEQRYDINIGLFTTFGKPALIKPYIELAFNLNNTKVVDASVQFRNDSVTTQSLTFSFLNITNTYYNIKDWGIGYGGLVGTGIRLMFNDKFIIYLGGNLASQHIYLGDNTGFHLQETIYFRLNYKMKFWKSKEVAR